MFARTPRLTLRPGWPEDAPALAAAIAHESVVTMLARAPWPYRLPDAEMFLAEPFDPRSPRLLILVHASPYPRIIGGIGLARESTGYELGYWLTPAVWGQGYATEAGIAVLAIARHAMGLQRLSARCFVANQASRKVLENLGFKLTGETMLTSRARTLAAPATTFEVDLLARQKMPALDLAA